METMTVINYSFLIVFFCSSFTNGCQSGSGGCCKKQQPVIVNCGGQSSCQQGYGCGQYGCAKRKAFAGITKRIDGVLVDDDDVLEEALLPDASISLRAEEYSQNVTLDRLKNPNFIFRSCCEARGLPDACLFHCHFNTYTSSALEAMFHKRDKCPIEALNEIHYCAAQGIDHRMCCESNGVASTAAGKKCLSFCDQRPNKFTPIDATYLPCYEVFEGMKQCFYHEIKRRAEKKFGVLKKSALGSGSIFWR